MPNKRKTYTAKRNPETGTWNVFDDKGQMVHSVGTCLPRSTARKFAFLLTSGRMVVERRHPDAMAHSGVPGHILGPQLQAKQDEERENFQRNKIAILRGIREQEKRDAMPVSMKGW